MSYLEKVIGLTGTTPGPMAGVALVNDLPIISESFVSAVAKKDEANLISDVWTRIVKNAEMRIEQDLFNELMKEDRFRQTMARTHYFEAANGIRNASARWEGARFQCVRQEYTKLKIQSVYVSGIGNFTVKCFNLVTGEEVFAVENINILGEGYITIEKEIALSKLTNDYLIAVDATNVSLGAINGNQGFFYDSCTTGYDVAVTSGYINDSQDKKAVNFAQSSCFVHVVAEIESDMNAFCSLNTPLLRTAAWHLAGSLLLNESLTTDSFNLWTNTNRIARQDESITNEQLYKQYLKKLVQPVLMRLAPTNIIEPKDATEKEGINIGDFVGDSYDVHRRNIFHNDLPGW